jgi:hypothetical protein
MQSDGTDDREVQSGSNNVTRESALIRRISTFDLGTLPITRRDW